MRTATRSHGSHPARGCRDRMPWCRRRSRLNCCAYRTGSLHKRSAAACCRARTLGDQAMQDVCASLYLVADDREVEPGHPRREQRLLHVHGAPCPGPEGLAIEGNRGAGWRRLAECSLTTGHLGEFRCRGLHCRRIGSRRVRSGCGKRDTQTAVDLVGGRGLEEQSEGLGKRIPRFDHGPTLACDIQLRTQGHVAVAVAFHDRCQASRHSSSPQPEPARNPGR